MKKVGILGGTFDPPHLGHFIIANEVKEELELDEIWFMPNQEPPHKVRTNSVPASDRVRMLELGITGRPGFKVETIELDRQGPSYTYDTIKQLNELYKQYSFYFIIGADMVEYLPKWHNIDELITMVQFIGVNRPAYELESDYPITYANVPDVAISSSMIRDRLQKGRSITYLVPNEIRDYIKEKKLYGP
ncbi:nicotinate-nucleotide adenylyltransferase [Cytobacillus gottheilii]|uniref:nicotinate-nucleotide adenylyltransferase n=1 Tax=Cytobacillus gottheilii TaxID=859144 RepID=UPI0009BA691B|nr:nicotinate-nucleotide adenylyltransferase [Cytobacillus gottheilii]